MSIQERMQSPTPPFFARLRNWSLILAAASGAILATPVALPVMVVKIAGYLAVAGSVAGAVSQAVVSNPEGWYFIFDPIFWWPTALPEKAGLFLNRWFQDCIDFADQSQIQWSDGSGRLNTLKRGRPEGDPARKCRSMVALF
jgi:hypothetical protein